MGADEEKAPFVMKIIAKLYIFGQLSRYCFMALLSIIFKRPYTSTIIKTSPKSHDHVALYSQQGIC